MFSFTASDRADRGFLVLLLILAVFYCVNLDSYPLVWVDEPWESITAYRLITDGRIYNPLLEGRAGWDEVFLEPRMLLNLLVGGSFAIFGTGIIPGRMVSVLFGILLVAVVYVLGKKIFSPRAALLAS
ncbi:MAG: glycosyltransferase family 39 protein, partial [Bacteroidota bacterium]